MVRSPTRLSIVTNKIYLSKTRKIAIFPRTIVCYLIIRHTVYYRLSKHWPCLHAWADSPWRWYPSASARPATRPGRSLSGARWSQPPVCRDPRSGHRRSRYRSSYPDPCLLHPREPDHRLPTLKTGQTRSSLIDCPLYGRKRDYIVYFPIFQRVSFTAIKRARRDSYALSSQCEMRP